MSGAAHTPGPWSFDGPPDNHIIWSGQSERVAFMAHSNGSYPERDTANARLIAAAPELLEALEAICAMQSQHYGDATASHLSLARLSVASRTVIDKARGDA